MAAGRIKGITVEIGGDTTKLQTALKGVNSEIKNTQAQLKDVEKLLKLDPGNTELLAQKQKLLSDAVSETKDKLTTLKTAAEQANTVLANGDISQEQYDALQREIIETEQDLKKLEEQAKQSDAALQKIAANGEKLKTVGDNISSAGQKMLPVTAAVTGLGTAAVTTAANFESSMSQVQATMGVTKDAMSTVDGQSVNTMDTLSELAKKMGAETAFSAKECADALNYLALAGYDTQQMCDTLPTVLNLAAAGDIDLASASDMVTDAMSALGMGVDESTKMVDQMAKTASSTNTSVAQLGEGILTIGATAKSIKGGTAELNTALGILANNGIKGAEGGTHLRNVILSLQNPTDKAAAQMDALGVSVYDSNGNMRSLNDILGDLNKSITLPSGRTLAYVKPRIGENRFGGESVTYEGMGGTKKWERIESYGPKFVENIVQATSRDILMYAMKTLRCCSIVAHVHDELIIEANPRMSLEVLCEQMARVPPWAKGLILRADGYTCDFYRKD